MIQDITAHMPQSTTQVYLLLITVFGYHKWALSHPNILSKSSSLFAFELTPHFFH
uniref:Uncharacterized protein n=1 Tax=Parascaris univalens TaxID=6257 RepID=A0A915BJ86_PARUN